MNRDLIRALNTSVAMALLAGCSGSTSPIGVNAASPGASAQATTQGGTSGDSIPAVAKEAWSGDLLYVATGSDVYVLSYPSGKLLGRLPNETPWGGPLASARTNRGNVFVVGLAGVAEYSHRGKHITTLQSTDVPTGCSVNPTTGNLAVPYVGSGGQYVVIYPGAREPGQKVYGIPFPVPGLCGYDVHGNLFVDGRLSRCSRNFRKAPRRFTTTILSPKFGLYDSIHWDGTLLSAIQSQNAFDPPRAAFAPG